MMAAKKQSPKAAPEKVELYDKLIASFPDVPRKGAANPYTSLNGNMFSFLGHDGKISLRVSKEFRNNFLERYPEAISISYNTVMKEYISIPAEMENDFEGIRRLFGISYDFAKSLKPKPTKK